MDGSKDLIERILSERGRQRSLLPDKERGGRFIDRLFGLLFGNSGVATSQQALAGELHDLQRELAALVDEEHAHVVQPFFDALPGIYEVLLGDARAILNSDPAARSLEEVLSSYPGFYATFVYRIAHVLWFGGCRLLARFFAEYAHGRTGIDIHPGARIGASFAIDHGTGVVIGETSDIGDGVKIYQGVTLGALNVSKEAATAKRHPTIGSAVVIYAGATILGGETEVGAGSIIGGNVWLTYSVPPNSVVYHKSEVHIKTQDPFPEPINFII
ncbi:MAG: serine acetyltransferase [Chitinophagaceae bacterium]|nr:MAG: serine acetyltransferase [Chitinophagaceae bacterium]